MAQVTADLPDWARFDVRIPFSANGGRTRGVIVAGRVHHGRRMAP
jgi:hypothetical protein